MSLSSGGIVGLPDLSDLPLPLELHLGVVLVLAVAALGQVAAEVVKVDSESNLESFQNQ